MSGGLMRTMLSSMWPVIGALVAITAGLMALAGLRLDGISALPAVLVCIGLEGLAGFYRTLRPDAKLAATLRGMAQLIAASAAGAALSYAAASLGGPLWDDRLQSWDRALGLDWRTYLAFVDARPWLGLAYTLAYRSLMPQFLVAVVGLGFTGREREMRELVLAFVIAMVATVLISGLMPAMAMFVHLGLTPRDFSHLDPAAAFVHVADLAGLREGTLRTIAIGRAEGIITFPSFHAVLGVLFTLALWPLRMLRWPILALNLLLIAATPIDGGHYFVDVMAGGAIALLAMATSRALIRAVSRGAGRSALVVATRHARA